MMVVTILLAGEKSLALSSSTLGLSLTSGTVAETTSLSLLLEVLLTKGLSLGLDNVLNELTLVLESVTLGKLVQGVVKVLVNLSVVTVSGQLATENSQTSHPQNLRGHTSLSSTLTLTVTGVTSSTLGLVQSSSSGPGVAGSRLGDDETVGHELSHGLSGVSTRDLRGLVRVHPDLSLTDAQHVGGQSLLQSEVCHYLLSYGTDSKGRK